MARILLAEDDASMRAFLGASLRRAGHAVDAVGDGASALAAVVASRYDLLLADIVMPGIDGLELARRATSRSPGLRIMFITGFAAVVMTRQTSRRFDSRVLSKPFHLRDLVREVDKVLAA